MSFIRKDYMGRISVRHQAKSEDLDTLKYTIESFGF